MHVNCRHNVNENDCSKWQYDLVAMQDINRTHGNQRLSDETMLSNRRLGWVLHKTYVDKIESNHISFVFYSQASDNKLFVTGECDGRYSTWNHLVFVLLWKLFPKGSSIGQPLAILWLTLSTLYNSWIKNMSSKYYFRSISHAHSLVYWELQIMVTVPTFFFGRKGKKNKLAKVFF